MKTKKFILHTKYLFTATRHDFVPVGGKTTAPDSKAFSKPVEWRRPTDGVAEMNGSLGCVAVRGDTCHVHCGRLNYKSGYPAPQLANQLTIDEYINLVSCQRVVIQKWGYEDIPLVVGR